jgi:hypothetical protein
MKITNLTAAQQLEAKALQATLASANAAFQTANKALVDYLNGVTGSNTFPRLTDDGTAVVTV